MMARITVSEDRGFDMTSLDFSRLDKGSDYVEQDDLYSIQYGDGHAEEFGGHGFTYDGHLPISGVVTNFSATDSLGNIVAIDDLQIAAADIGHAAGTAKRTDDYAIVRHALSGDDTFIGGSQGDVALGFRGNDLLKGGAGVDILAGGQGDDTLVGGDGTDVLIGGTGADTFQFNFLRDSNAEQHDTIVDFSRRQHDQIDLTGIDVNGDGAGHGHFHFIGTDDFSGAAGELRVGMRGGVTTAMADIDGDGQPDFVISIPTLGHPDDVTGGVFVG
jgi:Ca2+-binding RTX toxin-like protein